METQLGRITARVERPEPLKFAWPIIVLPELFTTPRHLAVIVGYFATIGWEVYAPDLRSAGGKGLALAPEHLRFDDMVELAAEALAGIGCEAVVVGHGAGGLVALKLAERAGVKAVVALAPLVPGFRTPLFRGAYGPLAAWKRRPLKPPTGRMLFEFVADAEPFQRAEAIKTLVPAPTVLALEIAHGEVAFLGPCQRALRFIVAGDSDIFAPFDRVEAFARTLGAKVARIEGRGHWLVGGRALERAVAEIQRFLVRSLGQDLLLLYAEQSDDEPDRG